MAERELDKGIQEFFGGAAGGTWRLVRHKTGQVVVKCYGSREQIEGLSTMLEVGEGVVDYQAKLDIEMPLKIYNTPEWHEAKEAGRELTGCEPECMLYIGGAPNLLRVSHYTSGEVAAAAVDEAGKRCAAMERAPRSWLEGLSIRKYGQLIKNYRKKRKGR